jgi:hypothetical protein
MLKNLNKEQKWKERKCVNILEKVKEITGLLSGVVSMMTWQSQYNPETVWQSSHPSPSIALQNIKSVQCSSLYSV